MSRPPQTAEARLMASYRIHQWKPWEKSTGPKSDAGKAAVSKNGWKHGRRSAEWRELECVVDMLLNETR